MNSKVYDVAIVGGGAAGVAAAIGAARNGAKKIVVLDREVELGGVLQQCIHNGFGVHMFNEELTGPSYSEKLVEEMNKFDIEVKLESIVMKITKDKEVHYMNEKDGYGIIKAKSIVTSVGCRERTIHQIEIPGKRLTGIMNAGMAQRYLNIDGYMVGKRVIILGSGDIGLIMARRMTLEGSHVVGVVELLPYSNGLNRNIAQCLLDFDIPLYLSHTVTSVSGDQRLEKVVISEVDEKYQPIPGTEKEFDVDTLLLSVGLIPENHMLREIGVEINPKTQGAIVDNHYQTSVKGVFACGNSLHVHDIVDWASEEGIEAGKFAAISALNKNPDTKDQIEVLAQGMVRYTVPNKINLNKEIESEDLVIKFRINAPLENGRIIIKYGDTILKDMKKMHMIPSEMEEIKIPLKFLEKYTKGNNVTVEVKRVEKNG
jgi:NADPH-dependent 2,4-dienoyl-CoA reductase/sulfur reductase-like enzyme